MIQLQNSSARKNALLEHLSSASPRMPYWASHRRCGWAGFACPRKMPQNHRFCALVEFCNWIIFDYFQGSLP